MFRAVFFILVGAATFGMVQDFRGLPNMEKQIAETLDDWHDAAARADEERFFKHFTTEAIYMGLDEGARWTRDELRKQYHPSFKRGEAWKFKATKRNIYFSNDNRTAWFDEEVERENLPAARGTGVLVQSDNMVWKIAHYNLSVPIQNEANNVNDRNITNQKRRK